MQSALKLSALLLCLSLVVGESPPPESAAADLSIIAGCPAAAIECPGPRPSTPTADTPAPPKETKKGQKGGKG